MMPLTTFSFSDVRQSVRSYANRPLWSTAQRLLLDCDMVLEKLPTSHKKEWQAEKPYASSKPTCLQVAQHSAVAPYRGHRVLAGLEERPVPGAPAVPGAASRRHGVMLEAVAT